MLFDIMAERLDEQSKLFPAHAIVYSFPQTKLTMRSLTCFLFAAVLLSGCVTTYNANYEMGLENVTRPADAQERYGEQTVTETDTSLVFEDGFIRSVWVPTGPVVAMTIENKTSHSINIVWDEGAYVDTNGNSAKLVHGEVRRYQAGQSIPNTVIPAQGRTVHFIGSMSAFDGSGAMPRNVTVSSGQDDRVEELRERVKGTVGQEIRILLPLRIQGETNEYTFAFRINEADIEEGQTRAR